MHVAMNSHYLFPLPNSGASFSSDISDIVASSGGELGNPLTPDNMLVDMDMPMETGESNLSEIFEILKADGTGESVLAFFVSFQVFCLLCCYTTTVLVQCL